MDLGRLGCAASYAAQLVYAPRNDPRRQLWRRANLPNVSRITWGRRLNETSQATVEVQTQSLSAECCALLAEPDYWAFELRLFRIGTDGSSNLVWEGPIIEPSYRTGKRPTTFGAWDVSDWLNGPWGLMNHVTMNYTARTPVATIARDVVRRNLAALNPPDNPIISDYIAVMSGSPAITYRRGAVNEYIADTIADLQSYGLDWTVIGRRIIYMPVATSTNRPAQVRLSDSDIDAEITVTRDGHELGNVGWGVRENNNGTVTRYSYGNPRGIYGRHDRINTVNDAEADADDLRAAARQAIAGRSNAQISIDFSRTSLRASTPITVDQLVPGSSVHVSVAGLCIPVQALMQITDVACEWVPGGAGRPGVESITCGLTQLGDVMQISPEGT